MRCSRIAGLFPLFAALLLVGLAPTFAQNGKAKKAGKEPAKAAAPAGDLDDLLDGNTKGTRFRLVKAGDPTQGLDPVLYWRILRGVVAAETAPPKFVCAGEDVIAPKSQAEAGDPSAATAPETYPTEGRIPLADGKHTLTPGEITVEVKAGVPSAKHPAVKIATIGATQEILILCAPVRFESVDAAGIPVPSEVRVLWKDTSLLRKPASFNPLVLWLPVGLEYSSNFGSFALSADGKFEAGTPAKDVKATAAGFLKTVQVIPTLPRVNGSLTYRMSVPLKGDVPESKRPGFAVFVVPFTAGDNTTAWLAVSKRAVTEAASEAFDPRHFARSLAVRGQGAFDPEKLPLQAGAGPQGSPRDLAPAELKCNAEDIAWLKIPLPEKTLGPVRLVISHKVATPFHTSVLAHTGGAGFHLIPHRWRTDFTGNEQAIYTLYLPKGDYESARIRVESVDSAGRRLGEPIFQPLKLSPVKGPGFESVPFAIDCSAFPAGEYTVRVVDSSGNLNSQGVPLRIFDWLPRSPFFVHSMSGCTTSWPTSEAGLAMLNEHGLEMVTATGHNSQLDTELPKIDASLAARLAAAGLDLPAEIALTPTDNDRFLSRLLRNRLRLIDLTICRSESMYNEGLSYHHSYQPSVDRMVRRMQVFTQQTGDYPSFAGVNYSWFPAMYGYVEGGVPTDAHTKDRNQALAANLKASGIEGLTREERTRYDQHKFSKDPAERERAMELMNRAVTHWKKSNEFGWGKHNPLYNQAVREVRPDALCTLFENAGHDEHKRTRSMFAGNSAACYESYTDFGDWPISSAFTVDWAHGNSPGQPVWLTTCWGTSSEGKMKSLFHSFARGMEGGGVPLEGDNELSELARRATGMKFLGQYGAVSRGTPDRRLAILSRAASLALTGRQMYEYHAAYAHLTRLGYPAILVGDDEVLESGVPKHVEVLLLVEEKQPLEPAAEKALAAFVARGGKLLQLGESLLEVAGATQVKLPIKNIWELKGFHADTHQELWKEFAAVREPLAKAMKEAGLEPLAVAEPQRGFAVAIDGRDGQGEVRYVAVIADAADTHSNAFVRSPSLAVSLAGTGWTVRDLVKQQTLPCEAANGRSTVMVDLVTEPTTLLALYKKAPAKIAVRATAAPSLASELGIQSAVLAGDESSLGYVPVRIALFAPDGSPRGSWHRGAGDEFRFPLARHDQPGNWKVIVQELLTGLTATAEFAVAAADKSLAPSARAVDSVHVVDDAHLAGFSRRTDEKVVIVEPEQQALLPVAKKLTDALLAAGIKARLWQVKPEEYDTLPVRWYPRPEDTARMNEIAAGRLIGLREGMRPYIDKIKRNHVPELGGYGEIDPGYIVGQDAIVFSGGRLCESLRSVTTWIETPASPGKGQGRLVVCFSPFQAARQVTAVVANDAAGLASAAETLAAKLAEGQKPVEAKEAAEPKSDFRPLAVKLETTPIAKPYGNFSPIERIERLLATRDGKAAVLVRGKQDNVAFVDPAGKVTGTVFAPSLNRKYPQIDNQGRLVVLERKVLAVHPGWGFPTEHAQTMVAVEPNGTRAYEMLAYTGNAEPPIGIDGCYLVGPDARPAVLPREGGYLDRLTGEEPWRYRDELPHSKYRFEMLFPRTPVAAALSPDGKFLFLTFDSRPPLGAFSNAPNNPTAAESVLIERATGKRLWSLRDADYRKSTYAAHPGFVAVASEGKVTALADHTGTIYLVDKAGQITLREQITTAPPGQNERRVGPPEGLGVWISDSSELAAFVFKNEAALAAGGKVARIALAGIASASLDPLGSQLVVAQASGQVQGLSADGTIRWTCAAGGISPQVAALADGQTLVGTSDGAVIRLDAKGQEVWRADVASAVDHQQHPLKAAEAEARLPAPQEYQEPGTLELAQAKLQAKELLRWKPRGDGRQAFGRTFYPIDELTKREQLIVASSGKDLFAHLVYRKLPGCKKLTVSLLYREMSDKEMRTETFELDLDTPEYRVVDLPARGQGLKVTVEADGPAEIAEFSLWSMTWPGANLAYIRPATENLAGGDPLDPDAKGKQPKKPAGDDLLDDLLDPKAAGAAPKAAAKLKDCRVWWPNTDPDQVAGPWLRAPLDPTQIVDDKRFGGGKLPPFAGGNNPSRGGFFTIDFGQPTAVSLVAVYERVTKQSAIAAEIALFTGKEHDHLTSGTPLVGVTRSDQFWRLFPLEAAQGKVSVLGVHVSAGGKQAGLSEVEAYGK